MGKQPIIIDENPFPFGPGVLGIRFPASACLQFCPVTFTTFS